MTQQEKATDTSSPAPENRKGEEMIEQDGKEAGRFDEGETGANRPTGTSTARDSTAINAEDENPIDPESPNMPPA
jgi:hypothetical protein